jgi:hypothetical protein
MHALSIEPLPSLFLPLSIVAPVTAAVASRV